MIRIITLFLLFIWVNGELFALSDMQKREKFIRCERYCTMKYEQCMERVFSLQGKAGDRARITCQSHFTSCTGRCGQFRD